MHDIRLLRDDPAAFAAAMQRRGAAFDADAFAALDTDRRQTAQTVEAAQAERNRLSREIGKAFSSGDRAGGEAMQAEVARLKQEISDGEAREAEIARTLSTRLAEIPNVAFDDVPDGADENDNVEVKAWSTPTDLG